MLLKVELMTEQINSWDTALEAASRRDLHQSQKLVRCITRNARGEGRLRLVELESFKLWEYLMTSKHRLRIEEPAPCLWVHREEYEQNEAIYSHAANVEQVNRVVVSIYDEYYSFSHIVNRFAHQSDTAQLVQVLRSHMQGRIDNGDECDVFVIPGYCVERWHHADKPPLSIGLAG